MRQGRYGCLDIDRCRYGTRGTGVPKDGVPENGVPAGRARERASSSPSSQDTNWHPGDYSRLTFRDNTKPTTISAEHVR